MSLIIKDKTNPVHRIFLTYTASLANDPNTKKESFKRATVAALSSGKVL